jgi:hypothetical protein
MRIAILTILCILPMALAPGLQISGAQAVSATGSAHATSIGGCTGLPYSGKETTTRVQTRADGTSVVQEDVHLLWRDAEGRTRSELAGKSPSGAEYDFVTVYEPVKRVYWTWSAVSKPANKFVNVRPFAATEGPASCWKPVEQVETVRHVPGSNATVEKLPPTTISGLPVLGNRNTFVIPAGTHSNDREITVRHEFWISPDLGVIVRHVIDDPRVGKITTELSDIKRSVPDPALFKVPEGYQMRDEPPPVASVLDGIMQGWKPVLPQPPPKIKDDSNRSQSER